ncbi:hypothetical protein LTV02_09805 [Nocardia yamanashiensis]|uniref:hypothetical protein n=1 Tax=Nocardia yamanashiensis TaxID=209247 RepID=UPI001E538571|nr:hypothetical protein [Nocardia yamanashiensis]UGT43650.1 hypothetical protein LTV02_09805 [Nocardia yamanashiensis]
MIADIQPLHLRPAVGFIRRAISAGARARDEDEIHTTAARLGYNIAAIVYDVSRRGTAINQLMAIAWSEDAEAIVIPSRAHLLAASIDDLLPFGDVILVDSGQRFTKPGHGVAVVD